jgi:hypothetical protein
MELLDRYLHAVKKFLPKEQQDNIVAELSDDLRSQMEDREAELGRPLTEAEQEAVLKAHGHPVIVAGRYRQDRRSVAFGRQLIGPVLFPFYVKVLSFNLGITLVVCLLVAAFFAGGGPVLGTILFHLLLQFGIVTLVFCLAEASLARFPEAWDPRHPLSSRRLSAALQEERKERTARNEGRQIPRLESFSQLVALAVLLGWLQALRSSAHLFGSAPLGFAPVWQQVYLPVVLLNVAGMAQAAVNLFLPRWTRFHDGARVVLGVFWLAVLGFLLRAGAWIVLVNATDLVASRKLDTVNHFVFYVLLITAAASAVQLLVDARRWIRRPRPGTGAPILGDLMR